MRPKVIFFDFIETLTDVSDISEKDLRDYADWARLVAEEKIHYVPFEFCYDFYDKIKIKLNIAEQIKKLQDLGIKCVVLTNVKFDLVDTITDKTSSILWDGVIGSDFSYGCKPNRKVYIYGLRFMGLKDVKKAMMVAAHQFDVDAAVKYGMQGFLLGKNEDLEGLVKFIENKD